MASVQKIELLLNDETRDHNVEVVALFQKAERFECLVAFAKHSVWRGIKDPLEEALKRGMKARLAIGLNFYHTDPELLRVLWRLAKKYDLRLFLSNVSDSTFHPKIYAYRMRRGCRVVIGSANFTLGGLRNNYEASALIDDASGAMMSSVTKHFDSLIDEEAIVPASKDRIDQYAKEHKINAAWFRFAKRKAGHAAADSDASLDILLSFLNMMKKGGKKSEFATQMKTRRAHLANALPQLRSPELWNGNSKVDFLRRYCQLIESFHSGGLKRGMTHIAGKRNKFAIAISAIANEGTLTPRDAFSILHRHFLGIKGAGINLLTEILHTLDNKRFAVMNQNAVSGLRLVGYDHFPQKPSKTNTNADLYQLYCDQAGAVRDALGLTDFTELDALFNYVYWNEDHLLDEEDE